MKFALISGGSRGLGKSLVDQLSEQGWTVRELSRSGEGPGHIKGDFADPAGMNRILSKLWLEIPKDALTELLLVLNAAQLGPIRSFHSIEPKEIENAAAVNLVAPMEMTLSFMKSFRKIDLPKTIVNISSGAAKRAKAGWSQYCMAKAGMENFIHCLRLEEELLPNPFGLFSFDPGIMDTEMQAEIRRSSEEDFPELERFKGFKADGQLQDPHKVAAQLMGIIQEEVYPFSPGYSVTE